MAVRNEVEELVNSAPERVQDHLVETGRTYFQVESTYWGSEAFGTWSQEFTGKLAVETDKGIKFEDVRTLGGTEVGEGWLPKSKVVEQVTGPEPTDFVIVNGEGVVKEGAKGSEGDYQIEKTDVYYGRHRGYNKYVLEFEFDEGLKANAKRDGDEQWWEQYHVSAKFENGDFKHWWFDGDVDLKEFAQELAGEEYTVAIKEEFLKE